MRYLHQFNIKFHPNNGLPYSIHQLRSLKTTTLKYFSETSETFPSNFGDRFWLNGIIDLLLSKLNSFLKEYYHWLFTSPLCTKLTNSFKWIKHRVMELANFLQWSNSNDDIKFSSRSSGSSNVQLRCLVSPSTGVKSNTFDQAFTVTSNPVIATCSVK